MESFLFESNRKTFKIEKFRYLIYLKIWKIFLTLEYLNIGKLWHLETREI